MSMKRLRALVEGDRNAEALILEQLGPMPTHEDAGAKGGRGKKAADNVSGLFGNDPTYALRRLLRDAPELAARVQAGELSAHAAAVEAGFRRKTFAVDARDAPGSRALETTTSALRAVFR